MPLVSTIVRCCVHIVRLVCGRTGGQTKYVTLRRMRRGLITIMSDKLLLTGEKKRKREGGREREEKERREGEGRDVCLNVYEGLMHISTSVLFFVSRKCRFCY